MKTYLTENTDYHWIEKQNLYGFTHRLPQLTDGAILSKRHDPRYQTIVLKEKDNKLIPVFILDGQYEVNGRISNYWEWYEINEDLSFSEQKSGYGGFYEPHMNFKINYNISISI